MSNEKMRAEFEAWLVVFLSDADIEDIAGARAVDTDGSTVYCFPDDDEATMGITAMWLGWQASRAALVIDLPERITKESGYSEDDEYYNLALKHCQHQIEAEGVRVKP